MSKSVLKTFTKRLKLASLASFIAFFSIFSVISTSDTMEYSIASAGQSSQPFNESSGPVSKHRTLFEEELEEEVVFDKYFVIMSSKLGYLDTILTHFYINDFICRGYSDPLYRPPELS